ncbi:uncharacterized protein LOC115878207 [Sitophilus oryzae]|uniref:Uncharacterized protein LOC115878207 n=1 Tax=Sitophilus oryzae TaxID=7048 RepID=A0A6J2XHS8_SITOR|nr:uncharacterized protein LOC115878207 [Sitophilus oryzae]
MTFCKYTISKMKRTVNLSEVNSKNVDDLNMRQIEELIKKCFTKQEWYNMTYFCIIHLRVMFVEYIKSAEYHSRYTLETFLKESIRPDPLFRSLDEFWLNSPYDLDSSGSEIEQDIPINPDIPRKPTLEEIWDESDRENEPPGSVLDRENSRNCFDASKRAAYRKEMRRRWRKPFNKRKKSKSKENEVPTKVPVGFKMKVKLRPKKAKSKSSSHKPGRQVIKPNNG